MPEGVRLEDTDVSLKDILHCVSGDKYGWAMLFLEATGHLSSGGSLPQLEKRINESDAGIRVTWVELLALAEDFNQVMDLLLVASRDEMALSRFAIESEMYSHCDVVIEMFDSSYWLIHAKERSVLDNLSDAFGGTAV